MGVALAIVAAVAIALGTACGNGLFQQYEYEEELYLSLDGSATLYVNGSIAALNALRGQAFAADASARAFESYYTAPGAEVARVTFSRRNDRRYVHLRLHVADVRHLGRMPGFAWSSYELLREGDVYVYRQRVGLTPPTAAVAPWRGDELVAFRLHLPSKVVYHNVDRVRRGNILAWEQSLADRRAGRPIEIETRIEAQSILYRTLGLFGAAILLVAVTFGAVLWWVVRSGD